MLSNLHKISKKLALIAASWVLFIAVHGIFVHKHQEINTDLHACVLCVIISTDSVFPTVSIPEPYTEFVQTFYAEIDCEIPFKILLKYHSRGPPLAFLR